MGNWEAYTTLLPKTLDGSYRFVPVCRKVKNRGGYIKPNT
jgi:hypothetical protein